MTAYDVAAWGDFASTVAGAAAALAGLLFVGLSLNLSEVMSFPGVSTRAAVTVGMTVALMLVAVLLATPGQSPDVLAVEIAAIAAVVIGGVLATGGRIPSHSVRRRVHLFALPLVPMGLLVIPVAAGRWGLYWATAAIVTGLAAATANSWVRVVEIKR